jgi:site-specific recombinase XerD
LTLSVVPIPSGKLTRAGLDRLPGPIARAGEKAAWRFIEFFAANIRNKNTRAAYAHAVTEFFSWCESKHFELTDLRPAMIGAYIEQHCGSAPTVKQHLAAIRMLFDWLVIGQIVPMNPASSVRGPKHVVKVGKTPVLTADQARQLLDSIDTATIIGLRDRALLGLMCYTFARVSATVNMKVEDYYQTGKRLWFRLHEKGGKRHEVPAHHNAESYLAENMCSMVIRVTAVNHKALVREANEPFATWWPLTSRASLGGDSEKADPNGRHWDVPSELTIRTHRRSVANSVNTP